MAGGGEAEAEAKKARRDAIRRRVHELLEVAMPGDRASKYVDIGLIVLIIANVVAVMLESVKELSDDYKTAFFLFEMFSVIIFSVEYFLRVWSCVESEKYQGMSKKKARLRFCITIGAITDLVAILPFYLLAFLDIDLRFLRVLRLRRGFKLTRYSPAMNLILGVVKAEARAFLAILFLLFLFVILASSFIYLFENKVQPEVFGTIPDAMDWSIRTLTTVGGVEQGPITGAGMVVGFVMSVIGLVIIALVTALLASSFIVLRQKRRQEFKWAILDLMEDDQLPEGSEPQVEHLRKLYGFSREDADSMISDALHEEEELKEGIEEALSHAPNCPHCGKSIAQVSPQKKRDPKP